VWVRPSLIAAVLVLGLVTGCAGPRAGTTPRTTVTRFAQALQAQRYRDAYQLMDDRYQRRVPFEEFHAHVREHPAEAKQIASSMLKEDVDAEVTASVPYGEGDEVKLLREDGEWKLHGNVVHFYDQSTPRAALRSFIRAMERRRYEVVMRFVPKADREGMTVEQMRKAWEGERREEIERLLSNLRANMDNPIEVVGDRATMPYGERFTVQFVREDGVWKIEDPD
jgi:hypothetical protein